MLALVRNVAAGGPGVIDRIDFAARRAIQLPCLGIYTNTVNPAGVLAPAPNGGSILVAMPDGNVMLYDANADTFTVSRKDFTALSGSYAASSYNSYVVGNNLLNASLVPAGNAGNRLRRPVRLRLCRSGRLPHHGVLAVRSGHDRALRRRAEQRHRQADPPGGSAAAAHAPRPPAAPLDAPAPTSPPAPARAPMPR